jgi:hypothetical protein
VSSLNNGPVSSDLVQDHLLNTGTRCCLVIIYSFTSGREYKRIEAAKTQLNLRYYDDLLQLSSYLRLSTWSVVYEGAEIVTFWLNGWRVLRFIETESEAERPHDHATVVE